MAERMGFFAQRRAKIFTKKQLRKQERGRRKLTKLQLRRDKARAKGKLAKADKITRKMKVVAAKTGVSVRAPPGVRRRAPRHKFRIRKGQKQEWSSKYRGWVAVTRRRRGVTRGVREEIQDLKQTVESLKTLIGVMR